MLIRVKLNVKARPLRLPPPPPHPLFDLFLRLCAVGRVAFVMSWYSVQGEGEKGGGDETLGFDVICKREKKENKSLDHDRYPPATVMVTVTTTVRAWRRGGRCASVLSLSLSLSPRLGRGREGKGKEVWLGSRHVVISTLSKGSKYSVLIPGKKKKSIMACFVYVPIKKNYGVNGIYELVAYRRFDRGKSIASQRRGGLYMVTEYDLGRRGDLG